MIADYAMQFCPEAIDVGIAQAFNPVPGAGSAFRESLRSNVGGDIDGGF